MLLRPATPLTILFLIAFVLLLLATLSTPIIKAIPLASFSGVDFGVFGYCQSDGSSCSGISVGYSTDTLFGESSDSDFSLPSSARHSLSSILIVHPIAALLTLICFLLAFAAHFHSPAHSPRYLLALLILTFPTLLVALLAFLVDILLFVPHMAWGGWIVLAATILIIASGVVTCAMRRTLVSRKARKKRIAENAEMNGQNYHNNLQTERMLADQLPRADSPPPMSGAMDAGKGAQYASFETSELERKSSDRTPLNPRAPSVRSASSGPSGRVPISHMGAPPMPNQFAQDTPRDQYGNPVSPGIVAVAHDLPPPGLGHRNSRGSLRSEASNRSQRSGNAPPPGYRGRGGFTGSPRGGYGPPRAGYNGPGGRGGYAPGPRGGFGPGGRGGMPYRGRGGPQGMRGPPPPGWQGPQGPQPTGREMGPAYGASAGVVGGAGVGMMAARGQQAPPPGYGAPYASENLMPPPGLPPFTRGNGSPAPPIEEAVIGQAIEMDERTGSPSLNPARSMGTFGLRDSDGDVAGMVGLQQPRRDVTPISQRQISGNAPPTPSSIYSQQTYVAPRPNWAPPVPEHMPVSPMEPPAHHLPTTIEEGVSPVIPAQQSPVHRRTGSDHYYEDVDPRFVVDSESVPAIGMAHDNASARHSLLPNALTPGPGGISRQPSPASQALSTPEEQRANIMDHGDSYDNLPGGARSPAGSDISHFTSISQRGINPNWRPSGPPSMGGGPAYAPPMQKKNERNDMILGANPDFTLPGMGPPRNTARGGGYRGGRGAPMVRRPPGQSGLTPQGRYPTEM